MSEKPLDFVSAPVVFNAFILMGINVAVIELGRRGLWHNQEATGSDMVTTVNYHSSGSL